MSFWEKESKAEEDKVVSTSPPSVEEGSRPSSEGEERNHPPSPVEIVEEEGGERASYQTDPKTFAEIASSDSSSEEHNVPILPIQVVDRTSLSVPVTGFKGKCASLDAGSEYVFLKTSVFRQQLMLLAQGLTPGVYLPFNKKLE